MRARSAVWHVPRRAAGLAAFSLMIAAAIALPATANASQARAVRHIHDAHFVWFATEISISGDTTYFSNRLSNGNRRALIFVTPNWNPVNNRFGEFDTAPVGVVYNTAKKRWGIFNEDGSAMQLGEAFNVLIVPKPTKNAFVHTATAGNIQAAASTISNAATNGNSHLLLQITQNSNPPGHSGTPNDNPVGAAYSASQHRWTVFQDNGADMTAGASFNILVGTSGTGARSTKLTASTANLAGDTAVFRNRRTNNDSKAQVFVTVTYAGLYVGNALGVWYDKILGRPFTWGVFLEDQNSMPAGAVFYLLYYTR
jgi:hypothetical protein